MAEASTDESPELRVWRIKNLPSDGGASAGTEYICLPLEQFEIEGPNGSHICFVYPVLGPKASSCPSNSPEDLDKAARTVAFKVVQALDMLHQNGICHGDLTPSNVLLQIANLDGLPEEEVIKLLGEPGETGVLTQSGEPPTDPSAPKYLVYPISWDSLDPKFLSDQPCIIDFGDSFDISDPPDNLGIPGPYRSPELILDSTVGVGCDLWALGCTLFEIRTGRKLLNLFDDDSDSYIDGMVQILGPLPEPWWSETWEMRTTWYEDEADSKGRAVAVQPPGEEMSVDSEPVPTSTRDVHSSVAQDARSIQEMLAPGLWYMPDNGDDIHREISKLEIEVFADLLGKLLRYKPDERLSAKEVLDHEWFRM